MAENTQKIDFKNEKVRKALYKELSEDFRDTSDEIRKWNNYRLALKEFLKENKTLHGDNLELYKECQDLLMRFQWYSFFYLTSDEVVNLFEKGLGIALSDKSYPLETYLHIFLLNIPSLSLREEYKEKLRQAIVVNEDRVSSGKIKSILDWLTLYNTEFGSGEVEKVRIAEFLNKNENVIGLNTADKTKIKRIFELYEELKIPADMIEGLEEEVYVLNEQEELELHKRAEVENITRAFEKEEAKRGAEEAQKEPPPLPSIDLDIAVKNAVEGANLTLEDESLKKRFYNIAKSYFGDIRTEIETRIVLKRDINVGGMGLDNKTADKVLNIFKKQKPQVTVEKLPKELEEKKQEARALELAKELKLPEELISAETRMPSPSPPVERAEAKPQIVEPPAVEEKLPEPEVPPIPLKPETPYQNPVPEQSTIRDTGKYGTGQAPKESKHPTGQAPKESKHPTGQAKEPSPEPIKPPTLPTPPTPPTPSTEKPSPAPEKPKIPPMPDIQKPAAPLPEEKQKGEEIRVRPRAQGPVDELRSLTIVDWRRFGTTQEAVQKIQDKIDLLAEESLVKKAEGIKAWKESEINKLYIQLGEESINQGKSVEEIINMRQHLGTPTLTKVEFDAVVGLNRKLRF